MKNSLWSFWKCFPTSSFCLSVSLKAAWFYRVSQSIVVPPSQKSCFFWRSSKNGYKKMKRWKIEKLFKKFFRFFWNLLFSFLVFTLCCKAKKKLFRKSPLLLRKSGCIKKTAFFFLKKENGQKKLLEGKYCFSKTLRNLRFFFFLSFFFEAKKRQKKCKKKSISNCRKLKMIYVFWKIGLFEFQKKIGPIPVFKFWVHSCFFFLFMAIEWYTLFLFFSFLLFFKKKKEEMVSMNVEKLVPFLFPRKFFWRKTTGEQPVTSFFFLDLSKYMYFFFLCLIQEQLDVFHYG